MRDFNRTWGFMAWEFVEFVEWEKCGKIGVLINGKVL